MLKQDSERSEMPKVDPGIKSNRPVRSPRRLIVSVGQDKGDLRGSNSRTIQAGVDYLGRLGGGTLQILPGEYLMTNFIYAHANVSIKGCGEETVLKKAPGFSSCTGIYTRWVHHAAVKERGWAVRL
jgi:hypothetical protein